MFGAMTRRNPFCDPEIERLCEASFDETLRRSVGDYLEREGMSASRFGRTVLGDPGFVQNRLMKGAGEAEVRTREGDGQRPGSDGETGLARPGDGQV